MRHCKDKEYIEQIRDNHNGVVSDLVAKSQWGAITGNIEDQSDLIDKLGSLKDEITEQIPTKVSQLDIDINVAYEDDIPTKVSQLENDVPYLTQHQDLSNYATKQNLEDAIAQEDQNVINYLQENYQPKGNYQQSGEYLTVNDLDDWATKEELRQAIITEDNNIIEYLEENYQPKGDYQPLGDYPTIYEMNSAFQSCRQTCATNLRNAILQEDQNILDYIDEHSQPKGNYLTEHQDISHLATKAELPSVPTMVSAFVNDADYITRSEFLEYIQQLLILQPLSATLTKTNASTVQFSNQSEYQVTLIGKAYQNGKEITPDKGTLYLDGVKILDDTPNSFVYTIANPQVKTYTFTYQADSGSQSARANTSITFALPYYYGVSSKSTVDNVFYDLDYTSLTPQKTVYVHNHDEGSFVWICIPSTANLSKVQVNSFDFPLRDPIIVENELGEYKCYRSYNERGLEHGTIKLEITY